MNRISRLRIGLCLLLTCVVALLATVISMGAAAPSAAPAFLQTATYKTSAKCKMCHKAEFTAWSATKHTTPDGSFPWEVAAKADGKPVVMPPMDEVYRHTTGFDAKANTWAEKGTSCEACHGPGSEHMSAKKEERKAKILMPTTLSAGAQVSLCGRCHGQYTIDGKKYAADYQLGQDLLQTEGFKLDEVKDGGAMQQLNEFVKSKHMSKGVTCVTCHTSHTDKPLAHNLRKPVVEQCLTCHTEKTMAQHAPNAAADATCATCHMTGGRHDFTAPKP